MTISEDPRLTALFAGADEAEKRAFWREVTSGRTAPDAERSLLLAEEILALRGTIPAAELAKYYPSLLVRADARLQAKSPPQARADTGPFAADLEILDWKRPFRGFFAVDEVRLRHRRFDGEMGEPLTREVFVAADAVTVLPYDPRLDQLLVIEQFRSAPLVRGEARPWLTEAIAGRIDPGETPEAAARREAREEAGVSLGELHRIGEYYPSPGAMTEYLWSFIGLCDLSGRESALHGLAEEGEDIRSHLISFDEAMAWLQSGRIGTAPLMISLLWLAGAREGFRAAAGG